MLFVWRKPIGLIRFFPPVTCPQRTIQTAVLRKIPFDFLVKLFCTCIFSHVNCCRSSSITIPTSGRIRISVRCYRRPVVVLVNVIFIVECCVKNIFSRAQIFALLMRSCTAKNVGHTFCIWEHSTHKRNSGCVVFLIVKNQFCFVVPCRSVSGRKSSCQRIFSIQSTPKGVFNITVAIAVYSSCTHKQFIFQNRNIHSPTNFFLCITS